MRRKLLGDNDAKTGGNLRYWPHQHWSPLGAYAAINNGARRFSDRFGEQAADGEVTTMDGIGFAFQPAQREHLQTA